MSGSLKTKAEKCWELADELRKKDDFNNCASRMYYAVFQTVVYFAVRKKYFDPEDARRKNLNVHYEMNKIVDKMLAQYSDAYEDMRALRNKADYDPDDVTAGEVDHQVVVSMESIKRFFLNEAEK